MPSGAGVPIGIKYSVSNLKFALKPDPGFAPAFKSDRKKKCLIHNENQRNWVIYILCNYDLEYGKERTKDVKD